MTRIEEVFNSQMELASQGRATMEIYWNGYRAGLMRAHFGSVAIGDKHHDAWQQIDALGELGRGYRDGFAKLTGPLAIAPREPGRSAGVK